MPSRLLVGASACALAAALSLPALAADMAPAEVVVTGQRSPVDLAAAPSPTEGVDARQIADTVNAVNAEDALRYLPDILGAKAPSGGCAGPDHHAHVRRRLVGPQPDLCRRGAAERPDRQQQFRRLASLRHGDAGGDRTGRCALRPLRRRLPRQFHRRGGELHHPYAGSSGGQPEGDRIAAVLRQIRDERHFPCWRTGRGDRRPDRAVELLAERKPFR